MRIPRFEGSDRYERLVAFLERQFPLRASELQMRMQFATPLTELTLTTAMQDVPDTKITVPRDGVYQCIAFVDSIHIATGGQYVLCTLAKTPPGGGTALEGIVSVLADIGIANHRATVGQLWYPTLVKDTEVKLQAQKTINAGTAKVYNFHTTLAVMGPLAVL